MSEEETAKQVCPRCGYMFAEEIYEIVRSNYNVHNEEYMCQQIQLIIDSISVELGACKEKYVELMEKLENQERAFDETQDLYEIYIRQRGLKDSLNRFNLKLGDNVYEQRECENQIKIMPEKSEAFIKWENMSEDEIRNFIKSELKKANREQREARIAEEEARIAREKARIDREREIRRKIISPPVFLLRKNPAPSSEGALNAVHCRE